MSVDPLAHKFPSLTPYNYCGNSPLIFIDPNGMELIAIGEEEQQMILNTLNEEDKKYVKFNEDGFIVKDMLNSGESESGNFKALLSLVKHEETFQVVLTESVEYLDENGQTQTKQMGDIQIETDKNNWSYYIPNTGEIGFTGWTQTSDTYPSPTGNNIISINSKLSIEGRAQTFSHEGYGHAYLYSIGKNSNHIGIPNGNGFREGNTILLRQIIERINETIKNMGN